MPKIQYETMRPGELADARRAAPLVYVAIGSLEYHGLHLPVGFDTIHAYHVCMLAAAKTGGVVLPPTYWGTTGHDGYPGSLLLSRSTITALVRDILAVLTAQEYRLIVLCTGHYPEVQGGLLTEVAGEHMAAHPEVTVLSLDPFTLHREDTHADHAGKIETSVMLALDPAAVDMSLLQSPGGMDAITPDCVDGVPEYGEARLEIVIKEMVRTVTEALEAL